MADQEQIVYTPLNNLRDLGGIAVTGGVVRPNTIWRGDDPSTSPAEEIEELVGRGLTTVIDLRGEIERGLTGIGFLADHDVTYVPVTIAADPSPYAGMVEQIVAGGPDADRLFGRMYARMVVDNIGEIARIVEIVADAPGAALIHCTAGKDRTGTVAAGVLALLGASDDDIAADFAVTETVMDRIEERIAFVVRALTPPEERDAPPKPRIAPDEPNAFMSARPATMLAMLTALRRDHGGYAELLRSSGVFPAIEQRLRQRVIGAHG